MCKIFRKYAKPLKLAEVKSLGSQIKYFITVNAVRTMFIFGY